MKTRANWRRWALGLSLAAMIGVAFWMRALASWRPQKVTRVAQPSDIYSLHISPDGRFLLAGFRAFYDLENEKWAPSVPPNQSFYGFAPNGTYFSAQDFYQTHPIGEFETPDFPNRARIFRRELATGKIVWSALDSHLQRNNTTQSIALTGDEKQVLVRGRANLKAFDARSGKMLWRRELPIIESGQFVKSGRFVWVRNGHQHFLQDVATGRILWRQPPLAWGSKSGISPDESLVWIVYEISAGHTVARFYDLESGKLLWTRPPAPPMMVNLSPPAFSSDSRSVTFMNWTGVEWFEAKSGKRLGSRRGPGQARALAMAFSRDGNWLYTSDNAGQIWKWRLK